ncbi:MAG TPA: ATP-binding cassette domain-containing protein [Armatimonadota bacterium]|jgi:phospholipid/cholesterol/gamma-HCH transport system ATP-binding protein
MISIRNLTYSVPGGLEVLKNVSLEIPSGTTMCVMGLSGTGKTSLLKCVSGLVEASGGEVWIGDKQIVGLPERDLNEVRLSIGYVFQYAALFDSMTVFDNVAFGPLRRGMKHGGELDDLVAAKLSLVGMDGTQRMMPSQLSGGMQKRVGLARALASDPTVLLYDEPTSGLDPVTAAVIDELIVEMRDRLKVTSLVVSHNVSSVFRIADIVTMLHDGEVIISGTPDEVRGSTDGRVRQFIEGSPHGPIEVV